MPAACFSFRFWPALVAFIFWTSALSAQITVSGRVFDETGAPLIGASVLVRGTAIGAVTDLDGRFEIQVPDSSAVLEVTYTGFESFTLS
ncbi:MAG: hypothetical protein D6714_17795, partial [Bacteroidetes bacterium]